MISVAPQKAKNLPLSTDTAQGPNAVVSKDSSNEVLESSRTKAEKLSAKSNSAARASEIRTKPVLVNVMDFIKKNTSRALWGLGLGTGGIGVASYFLIGSKILSLIFAVPTLMAFFIAHHLGKNITSGKNNLFLNPEDQIESYIADPQRLDSENVKALQSLDELKDLMVSKPERKEEILALLNRFKKIIEVKNNQVQAVNENTSDISSSRLKLDTERLLSVLDSIDELNEMDSSNELTSSKKPNEEQ